MSEQTQQQRDEAKVRAVWPEFYASGGFDGYQVFTKRFGGDALSGIEKSESEAISDAAARIGVDETIPGMAPLECVQCGRAIGPLAKIDADCAGWLCDNCYKSLQTEEPTPSSPAGAAERQERDRQRMADLPPIPARTPQDEEEPWFELTYRRDQIRNQAAEIVSLKGELAEAREETKATQAEPTPSSPGGAADVKLPALPSWSEQELREAYQGLGQQDPAWFVLAFEERERQMRDLIRTHAAEKRALEEKLQGLRSSLCAQTQHTACCRCMVDKHTPVRCDTLGGYICGGCLEAAYLDEKHARETAERELAEARAQLEEREAEIEAHRISDKPGTGQVEAYYTLAQEYGQPLIPAIGALRERAERAEAALEIEQWISRDLSMELGTHIWGCSLVNAEAMIASDHRARATAAIRALKTKEGGYV